MHVHKEFNVLLVSTFMLSFLRSLLKFTSSSGCDLSTATRKQAWLSFSYSAQKGPYLSIYYHW
jgi:hypothetical protein